ncbi:MAG: type VII toxin-antitoxin system HepT family RNase toxin [Candidatus Brocadiales bacterium]
MVISNLNIKLIEDRLGIINKFIAKLKRLSCLNEEDFLDDDTPAIAESYIRRSLEALFDIGRHIIAKTAGKGIVEYKDIANALGDMGIITKEHAERLRLMAGYRNRLVHFYHEVTDKELYLILKNNLTDIEDFVKLIKAFIEKYRQQTFCRTNST